MFVAECGTGKTLISLGAAVHATARGSHSPPWPWSRPTWSKSGRASVPHIPGIRVFLIDACATAVTKRTAWHERSPSNGRIVREGLTDDA